MELDPESSAADEESVLLARVSGGDREAFRTLYARYSRPLLSFAVRLVGNIGEAEEQLQDAFMKIWLHASSYDSRKSRPFTWAVTILRRTCIDHLRRRRHPPATFPFPSDETAVNGYSAGDTVRQAAESHEDSERLAAALAVAPTNQRRALELALFSEMTHAEIARLLDQPVGTIKSWIRRGLLDLHATLADPTP